MFDSPEMGNLMTPGRCQQLGSKSCKSLQPRDNCEASTLTSPACEARCTWVCQQPICRGMRKIYFLKPIRNLWVTSWNPGFTVGNCWNKDWFLKDAVLSRELTYPTSKSAFLKGDMLVPWRVYTYQINWLRSKLQKLMKVAVFSGKSSFNNDLLELLTLAFGHPGEGNPQCNM